MNGTTNAQPQIVVPGDGPGAEYVSKGGIVWILIVLSLLCLVLLGLLVWNWPDSEPRTTAAPAATQGTTTPKPSGTPAVTPKPSGTPAATPKPSGTPAVTPKPAGTPPAPATTPGPGATSGSETTSAPANTVPPGLRITEVTPSSGGTDGGTLVLISGSDFVDPVTVKFGEAKATDVVVDTQAQIHAKTPAHPQGAVDVSVTSSAKTAVLSHGFIYRTHPERCILLLVLLAGALGGTLHSIRSCMWYVGNRDLRWSWVPTYFLRPLTGAALAAIFFLAFVSGVWKGQAGSGGLWIVGVAALVGLFSAQGYEKLKKIFEAIFTPAPEGANSTTKVPAPGGPITINPTSGTAAGGTLVKITGTGFSKATTVQFGTTAAEAQLESPTTLYTVAPPHAAGAVDVTVTNPGTPPEVRVAKYTYT